MLSLDDSRQFSNLMSNLMTYYMSVIVHFPAVLRMHGSKARCAGDLSEREAPELLKDPQMKFCIPM